MTYVCPYCGAKMPSGYEPSQWAHCGEVGHAVTEEEWEALNAQPDLPDNQEGRWPDQY